MANFQDLNQCANDPAFRGRCLYATTVACAAALANASTVLQVTSFAQQIVAGAGNPYQIAMNILTNSTIASEITTASLPGATSSVPDSDLQFAANTLLPIMAGVQTGH